MEERMELGLHGSVFSNPFPPSPREPNGVGGATISLLCLVKHIPGLWVVTYPTRVASLARRREISAN
jgi:hypothetical protein